MKKIIYIFNNGTLKRKDNTIAFESELGRKVLPIEDISEIFIFGEVDLNKAFLDYMSQKEIILHFFNYYGYYSGSFYPREHLNSGYMILKQAENYMDEEKRLNIAAKFVEGSARNMLNVVKYYAGRGKDVDSISDSILSLTEKIKECKNTKELMGIEGNIREMYYKSFDKIIENEDFRFVQRTRRPPKNHLNALISFGNSMLYTLVLGEIYKTHLDPRIGYLHTTNFRRFTLNLDVAEIFKPIIVDRIIFTLIGKKMIKKSDFNNDLEGVLLKDSASKRFVEEFDKRLITTIKHRELGREVSYRRLIRMELYKLEKHLMGEKEYVPFVSRW
ncbi:CRISP-associated protein Cas1 [Proteiniborus ethanoligenes]|uniref:CRISPR-associated endonuclease Cas1 n=1 Tax=Proteiniborus ethanoligenes TaxID=415015 RepID=A0A1H3SMV6_9FIRM|nr:type I-B CRISPR-associated endonuclease Cas1b [Proteiniborus ethanoligenes]SDZ39316.1 CRISP-associated protein Cas1 [Proteiniborus ethanoligenes]